MKSRKIVITIATLLFMVIFLYYENNGIKVTNINFASKALPKNFNGYKILQISDLHSKSFGENQKNLVAKIKKAKPDIMVITGDLIDSKHYNEENCLKLVQEIKNVAPIYLVTGNHEKWSGKFLALEVKLNALGVLVLRNTNVKLQKSGENILLMGIDDPEFSYTYENSSDNKIIEEELQKVLNEEDGTGFKILLSHRPEQFPIYAEHNIDLTFSGHAHGGQVRLPIVGGLIAPNQGFFPKYTSGIYIKDGSMMIVSRGLGNSIIPQRIFNRPEIVVTTIRSK